MMSSLNSSVVCVLTAEGEKLFQCSIEKRNSSGHHCMPGIYNIEHYAMTRSLQTVSRGHVLVLSNRHCSTMNLVKEKQGGLILSGLKR